MLALIVVITIIGANLFFGFFVAARLGYGPQNFTELFTGIYGRPFQVNDPMGSRIRGSLTSGQRKLFYDSLGEKKESPSEEAIEDADPANAAKNCLLATTKGVEVAEIASVLLDEQRFVGVKLPSPNQEDANEENSTEENAKQEEDPKAEDNKDPGTEDGQPSAYVSVEDAEELEQWVESWDQHLNQIEPPADLQWWNDFLDHWDDFLEAWKDYKEIAIQLSKAETGAGKILEKAVEIFEAKKKRELERLADQVAKETEQARAQGKEARRRRREMLSKDPEKMLPPEYHCKPELPSDIVEQLKDIRRITIKNLTNLNATCRKLRHFHDQSWLGNVESDWLEEMGPDAQLDFPLGVKRFHFFQQPEELEEEHSLWAFLIYFSNSQRIEFQIGSLSSYSVSLGLSQTLGALEKSAEMETPFFRLDKKLFAQLDTFANDEDGKAWVEKRVEQIRQEMNRCTMFFGDMEIDPQCRIVGLKIDSEKDLLPQLQKAITRYTHETKSPELLTYPEYAWIVEKKKLQAVSKEESDSEQHRVALFSLFHNNE